jgi:hypothetical protein
MKINIYKNPFIVSKNVSSSYPEGTCEGGSKFQLSFMLLSLLWEETYSRSAIYRDQCVTQVNG